MQNDLVPTDDKNETETVDGLPDLNQYVSSVMEVFTSGGLGNAILYPGLVVVYYDFMTNSTHDRIARDIDAVARSQFGSRGFFGGGSRKETEAASSSVGDDDDDEIDARGIVRGWQSLYPIVLFVDASRLMKKSRLASGIQVALICPMIHIHLNGTLVRIVNGEKDIASRMCEQIKSVFATE